MSVMGTKEMGRRIGLCEVFGDYETAEVVRRLLTDHELQVLIDAQDRSIKSLTNRGDKADDTFMRYEVKHLELLKKEQERRAKQ